MRRSRALSLSAFVLVLGSLAWIQGPRAAAQSKAGGTASSRASAPGPFVEASVPFHQSIDAKGVTTLRVETRGKGGARQDAKSAAIEIKAQKWARATTQEEAERLAKGIQIEIVPSKSRAGLLEVVSRYPAAPKGSVGVDFDIVVPPTVAPMMIGDSTGGGTAVAQGDSRVANLHLRDAAATRPAAASVTVVQIRGSDAAGLGDSHGKQLGKTIVPLYRDYFGRYFSNPADREACLKAVVGFERFLAPEHVQEIRALASATRLTFEDLMLAQAFMDLTEAMGCSTITLPAAASPDGVARFGRNLDFASFNIADKNSVVLVFHPKDRYAFAAVSWPGMVGVLSGMNEHGLTLANMEVARQRRAPAGMPCAMLYRTLLERCKTVDEALALLEKAPRHSANSLMLMDASGNRAVAEITPTKITVRRAPDTAALISTNHHRGKDLDTAGRCDRFDALHEIARREYGRISEAYLEQFLGCAAATQNATIQSMVFEPTNRALYLAVGAGAPARGYAMIDLKSCFR